MKLIKILIVGIIFLFSANLYAADIHSNINELIAENQKGWKEFKNEELGKFFKKDGFRDFLDAYPVTSLTGGFEWKPGMGREFDGHLSQQDLALHGHTHRYRLEQESAQTIFNPGECAGMMQGRNAIGVVDLESMHCQIVNF